MFTFAAVTRSRVPEIRGFCFQLRRGIYWSRALSCQHRTRSGQSKQERVYSRKAGVSQKGKERKIKTNKQTNKKAKRARDSRNHVWSYHSGWKGFSWFTVWTPSSKGARARAQGRNLKKLSLSFVRKLQWIPAALPCWSQSLECLCHQFFSWGTVSLIAYFQNPDACLMNIMVRI